MLLETTRTYLRKLSANDAADFYALNQNPEVLKFTGDKPFESIESARVFLEDYVVSHTNGLGRLAVINKQNEKFIGWCGLKYTSEKDEYDIGFRFFKEYWNQGFATETALKCLEYGFKELKLKEIVGRAMVDNTASIRVLEKIGMKFKERFESNLHDGVVYHLSNIDFNEMLKFKK
jgi:RimJ/RimL family protein N-acetyltransferase